MKMTTVDERLQCMAFFSWRGANPRFMTANAGGEPRPEAGAQRTLYAGMRQQGCTTRSGVLLQSWADGLLQPQQPVDDARSDRF